MSKINLYSDKNTTATSVSNVFIDEYMSGANGEFVKIYLYLLRQLNSADAGFSLSEIADKFEHTEKDVKRALCYWERMQLLHLDYDSNENLVGIQLKDALSKAGANSTTAPSEKKTYTKKSYSADAIKQFTEQEAVMELVFIAEQYLGRTLTATDLNAIFYFYDELKLSIELIEYLIEYCVSNRHTSIRYIEKVAIAWAEANVTTPAEAQGHASRYDRTVYAVMNALGKTSTPTRNEVAYILRWSREYGFDTDVILEACGRTVLATDKHRFAYADSILTSWYKAGIHHVSDISGLDASFQKDKAAKPARTGSAAEYNRFMHSNYDFDALEQALLQN